VKWKCTHRPDEALKAGADLGALLRNHPGANVRKKDLPGGQSVLYLTTDNPRKHSGTMKKP